ncbi:MAG: Hsp20/alpha crystallin family protein [Prevotellaceae bacterium]|jgi:HSP20 family protein|nr:Hsp20/alpha crystallin family protein [Prevotellaceae bacterium]
MALVRFNQANTPSVFDRFFDSDLFFDWSNKNFSKTNTTLPSVNIKETKDAYELQLAVPGFEKTDFKVEVHNDVLTVSSEKKEENEGKDGENYTKREFSYQSFSRSFTLPDTADSNRIDAEYKKGILHVSIPKKEEAKPKELRNIEIK